MNSNGSGTLVCRYTYSAFGELLAVTDASGAAITSQTHIAHLNPFRYRDYYYDKETGYYYLQSRYYDPSIGRFLNADSQLNVKDGTLGYNLFAYCNNNPIMYCDSDGHSIVLTCIIAGAVIGAAIGGYVGARVSKKKTGSVNGWAVAGGIVGGAVVGGLIGWGIGAAITAIGTAVTGAAGTAAAPIIEKAAETYSSWQSAENALRNSTESVLPQIERTFLTPYGNRVVDAFNSTTKVIAEAKYGYQGLSSFISTEIQRDAWLLQNEVVNGVEWHFYYSQISNSIGASAPLYNALIEAKIEVFYH